LVQRAGEEAGRVVAGLLVGIDQDPDLTAAVVGTVVRLRREERDYAEVVAGRPRKLLREHERDLRRPEELALEVHEPLGRAQRAQGAPAHERRLVVDDDELLVVAVERALPRVERHGDAGAAGELVARLSHLAAGRVEQRQRSAGPGEDTYVDSLRRLGQELTQRRPVLLEPERGVEVP